MHPGTTISLLRDLPTQLLCFIPLYVPPGIPVLHPQSHFARSIYGLSTWLLYIGLLIFTTVFGLITYASWKFRSRADDDTDEPKQVYGSMKWEAAYIVGPTLILIVVFYFTLHVMHTSDPASKPAEEDVVAVGHQWWWEFRYPKLGFTTANELHIPVGQDVSLGLESSDVIHDFWVPELARKEDMIPGRHGHIWLAADHPGHYLGACAEFCGKEHAWMRIRVIAQTPEDFARWAATQKQLAAQPTEPPDRLQDQVAARLGQQEFVNYPCANCHTIAGTSAHGRIGPDLSHVASRETLAAGRLQNTPEQMEAWLHDPDQFKPGSHMPNLKLDKEQLQSLTTYLETLK